MKRNPIAYLIAMMSLCFVPFLYAQEKGSGVIYGEAKIEEGGISNAKQMALRDAFRNLVKEKVESILGSRALEKKEASILEEKIYSKAESFIVRYQVVSETQEEGKLKVGIEAMVSEPVLIRALQREGLLATTKPLIAIAIKEEFVSGTSKVEGWKSVVEAELRHYLESAGYPLVGLISGATVMGFFSSDSALRLEAYRSFSAGSKANFLLVGNAKAQSLGKQKDSETFLANAELNLELVKLGEEPSSIENFSIRQQGQGIDHRSSLENSLFQATKQILPEIIYALENAQQETKPGQKDLNKVVVVGLKSYQQYLEVLDSFKNLSGVNFLELWGFSPGEVRFLVGYSGNSSSLADSLSKLEFPEFVLKTKEVEEKTIIMEAMYKTN